MMTRSWRLRSLVGVSALALVTAGCGGEDIAQEPETAPANELAEPEAAGEPGEPTASEAEEVGEMEATEAVEPGRVTAYVVAYHWGWAIFDEDGDELDVLEVPVGTEIELIAVNDHASQAIDQLPAPVAEAIAAISWSERTQQNVEQGRIPDPQQEVGMTLSDALMAAHDGHDHMAPAPDHGLLVTGIGAEAFLDSHADEPQRLVFTVEREGTHEFRCTEDCGVGHEAQRWEMLVVAA
jgi:hypothetical protein